MGGASRGPGLACVCVGGGVASIRGGDDPCGCSTTLCFRRHCSSLSVTSGSSFSACERLLAVLVGSCQSSCRKLASPILSWWGRCGSAALSISMSFFGGFQHFKKHVVSIAHSLAYMYTHTCTHIHTQNTPSQSICSKNDSQISEKNTFASLTKQMKT